MAHVSDFAPVATVVRIPASHQSAERAAAPSNGVHQTCGGGSGPWVHHVVDRCEDPRVVKALEQPEADHRRDENRFILRQSDGGDQSSTPDQSQRLDKDPPSFASLGQPICGNPSQRNRKRAGEVDERGSAETGHGELHLKLVGEKFRGPEEKDSSDRIRSRENQHQHRRRPGAKDILHCGENGPRPGFLNQRCCELAGPSDGFAQKSIEHQAQDESEAAEEIKPHPPSVVDGKPGPQPASQDGSEINAGLMEGHRPGSRAGGMVVADKGHRCRKVESLAQSLECPDSHEMPEPTAPSGGDRDKTPEQASAKDQVLASKAVADESGEGRSSRVHPHERGSDPSELGIAESELLLERFGHRADGLPVGVVEEANAPEHEDDPPGIAP